MNFTDETIWAELAVCKAAKDDKWDSGPAETFREHACNNYEAALKELRELRHTVKQLEADKDGLSQEVQRLTIRIVESIDAEVGI